MSPLGTVVCDLDGVVYLGEILIPGADKAINELRREGWKVIFATNNASRGPADTARKIARLTRLDIEPCDTVSSAQAAGRWMRERYAGGSVLVLGGPGIYEAMHANGISTNESGRPDAVVVGLTMELSYDKIKQCAIAIRDGAQLVATNVDPSYPTPEGLWPGAGSLVAAVATAADAVPIVMGKPHQPMIDLISEKLVGDRVIVLGDRPDTDLALGRNAGWETVGVLTGVVSRTTDIPDELAPDIMLKAIDELPDWLATT
jgi:HAD superfamily hydrolase (TIGR01450 family)